MQNIIRLITLAVCGLLTQQPPLGATEIFVINSSSRTLSRIDTTTGVTDNSFAMLGLTPNLMDLDIEHIYVVCSGDNAIQVVSRSTGTHIGYIPVAASSNPYDVLKVGEFLYVSGLFTDKVYKISLQSNSVVQTLSVGTAPEGLCFAQGRLFVCNTGGYANNYANSSISVIDLDSFTVEATVPVWNNPQYISARNGFLHVSCTGNWSDVHGKVDIIDLDSLEQVHRLDIGGNPGSIWINEAGLAYLGDGMGSGLYSYNADIYEIYHNASNPIPYNAYTVAGNSEIIALLDPNWSGSSNVRVLQSDFTPLGYYVVGYSSTDITVAESEPSVNDDEIQSPAIWIYPNPLRRGAALRLQSPLPTATEINIYNLRGQRMQKQVLALGETSINLKNLACGVYLYRFNSNKKWQSGKFLIVE